MNRVLNSLLHKLSIVAILISLNACGSAPSSVNSGLIPPNNFNGAGSISEEGLNGDIEEGSDQGGAEEYGTATGSNGPDIFDQNSDGIPASGNKHNAEPIAIPVNPAKSEMGLLFSQFDIAVKSGELSVTGREDAAYSSLCLMVVNRDFLEDLTNDVNHELTFPICEDDELVEGYEDGSFDTITFEMDHAEEVLFIFYQDPGKTLKQTGLKFYVETKSFHPLGYDWYLWHPVQGGTFVTHPIAHLYELEEDENNGVKEIIPLEKEPPQQMVPVAESELGYVNEQLEVDIHYIKAVKPISNSPFFNY